MFGSYLGFFYSLRHASCRGYDSPLQSRTVSMFRVRMALRKSRTELRSVLFSWYLPDSSDYHCRRLHSYSIQTLQAATTGRSNFGISKESSRNHEKSYHNAGDSCGSFCCLLASVASSGSYAHLLSQGNCQALYFKRSCNLFHLDWCFKQCH